MSRAKEWAAPAVAAAAFAAVLAVFAAALVRHYRLVGEWARSDLAARARLAAAALAEPVRTLDFRAVRRVSAGMEREGLRLRIVAGNSFSASSADGGQGFFDSAAGEDVPCWWGVAKAGDFSVGVGRPSGRIVRQFVEALAVAVLGGLAGMFAMGAVFFALYRQRVRIRELARLEKFRREFIADVSHEIRTPLAGITGAADLLADCGAGMDPAKAAPLLEILRRESKRLAALVQQILDLARLEREGDVVRLAECDLAQLAKETAERFGVPCRIAGGTAPCFVRCDATLVSQALGSLVDNANKHSGSDEIFVECGTDGSKAVLAVEDRGVGVPTGMEERVFERFWRADPARAAETGGAGLGLAIVRRIARLHGGDARCVPARPRGARFEIILFSRRGQRLERMG